MAELIVIVADDLTGAIDSAAPFAARGARVRIALRGDAIGDAAAGDTQVLAIDTRSRALPADQAAERVAHAWAALAPLAPRAVIKKVDSRLQGHCGVEAERLLTLSGRSRALVCPAVPDQQRIVADGCLTGRGVARPIAVADRFAAMPCACPDAADGEDLAAFAQAILADPARIMAVGAAGLANALATILFGPAHGITAPPPHLPMLIAIGSRDPITDAQVRHLLHDHPGVACPLPDAAATIRLHRMPPDAQPDPAKALARFGAEMAGLVQATGTRTLLCSGGDTAAATMDALGVRQLVPEHEWCAGMPVARVVGQPGLRLLTKSGGFGDAGVLTRISDHARTGIWRNAA